MQQTKRATNYLYPISVWAIVILLLAPLTVTIYDLINVGSDSFADSWMAFRMILSFGAFCSIPVLLLSYLLFSILTNKQVGAKVIQLILAIVAAATLVFLMNSRLKQQAVPICSIYGGFYFLLHFTGMPYKDSRGFMILKFLNKRFRLNETKE